MSGLSILVVEDDRMTSHMLAHQLQKYGTVITTRNAQEAIANNSVQKPDVIFLDIHYKEGDEDGFDVLAAILSSTPDAYVIMFSGDNDSATKEKATRMGAKDFIAKPFHADDVTEHMRTYFYRS